MAAYIIETPNALQPLIGLKTHVHLGGISIRQWLEASYPGFIEFENPTICLYNGKPLLRKDWREQKIKDNDVINFIGIVGYGSEVYLIIAIVIAVIAIGVSIYMILTMPETPGESPASDPVFSTKGQSNSIRLGEPIEVNYGRNRIFPSLASRPFFLYFQNDQYQYSLFCIGQGTYQIEAVQIGDTDINDFQEVEYEVLEPGQQTTLFRTNVFTSPEAGGQTLYATNEPEFVAPGWVGPFSNSPPGTQVDRIEIDLSYPRGNYHQRRKDGDLEDNTIKVEFQKRLIDDAGNPLGPFTTLFLFDYTGRTVTPQRKTRGVAVTPGRYEVRGRYNGAKPRIGTRTGHTVIWEGMKGFIVGDEPDFGNVTLLAVKIKATNNLNSRTQERFNVIATRKLPVRDSSGGSSTGFTEPVPTRSIVWAFLDVFRATYGARITDERFFDLDALEALDAFYESRNEHFDWTFRDPITIWDAVKTIARVGRATPLVSGSLITMKRDGPLEVPVTLFSPDNMLKGTFNWNIKLWEPNEHDSLSVEYTEPSTGYKQENVLCVLPDSNATTDNPRDLRIPGIQDRDHAYREGLYVLAVERYLRENVSFETGLEGYIPSFGDLVAVAHDVPRWGQSGYILSAESAGGTQWRLFVSEPLRFEESATYQMLMRGRQAEPLGPFTAIETSDPKIVIVDIPDDSEPFDFMLGGKSEPMLFLFGVIGTGTKYGKVVRIEPQGGERIRITLIGDEPIVHSFDGLEAPPMNVPSEPPVVPDLPTIPWLTLSKLEGDLLIVQATWGAAFGAQYYIVETSYDEGGGEEDWELRGTTPRTTMQFQVNPGTVRVRVAAVNNGQGPWIEEEIDIGNIGGLHIYQPFDCDKWGIRWWPKLDADGWIIRVYNNMVPGFPSLERTTQNNKDDLDFDYTYLMAIADSNQVRQMLVRVDMLIYNDETGVLEEDGFPAELTMSNAIPAQPIHLGHVFIGEESGVDGFVYRLFWDNPPECDLWKVKIFISKVDLSAFDEDQALLVFQAEASTPGYANLPEQAYIVIPDESDGGHDLYFWWVAVFDVWGNEITSNISDPAILPEYVRPLQVGMTAHWPLDELSGTRYDARGTNDLSDVNTVGNAAGIQGNAAVFVSANLEELTRLDTADLSMGDIDFTVAGWVRFDAVGSPTNLIGKWEVGSLEYLISLNGALNQIQFNVSDNGSTPTTVVTNSQVVTTGVWYFLVAWHDAGADTINLSVNNNAAASAAHSTGVFSGTSDFTLGFQSLDGRLDSVSVWKRLLDSTERSQLYNAGSGIPFPF